jgi:hypothetical protein
MSAVREATAVEVDAVKKGMDFEAAKAFAEWGPKAAAEQAAEQAAAHESKLRAEEEAEAKIVADNEPMVSDVLNRRTKAETGADVAGWTKATATPCNSSWLMQKSGTCYFNSALNGMLVGIYSRSILASVVKKYVRPMELRRDKDHDDQALRDFFKPFPWDACPAKMTKWHMMRAIHALLCVSKHAIGTSPASKTVSAMGADPKSRNNASVQLLQGFGFLTSRKFYHPALQSRDVEEANPLRPSGSNKVVPPWAGHPQKVIQPILEYFGMRSGADFAIVPSTKLPDYAVADPPMMLIVENDNEITKITRKGVVMETQHMDIPRAITIGNCVYHMDHANVGLVLDGWFGHAVALVYCDSIMHLVDSNLTQFVPITLADVSIRNEPIRPLVNAYYQKMLSDKSSRYEWEIEELKKEMHENWGRFLNMSYAVYVRPDKVNLEVQCPALTPPGGVPL